MKLIIPTLEYKQGIWDYRQEFLDAGSNMSGTSMLRHVESIEKWFEAIEANSKQETCRPDLVPQTQFIYVRESDNRIVGMIQVRHYFNNFLEEYGGNIGYSIRPSERCKGYAKQMLHDTLPFCKELGLEKVLITCKVDNEGSRKTILSNGGFYSYTATDPDSGMIVERYWVPTEVET